MDKKMTKLLKNSSLRTKPDYMLGIFRVSLFTCFQISVHRPTLSRRKDFVASRVKTSSWTINIAKSKSRFGAFAPLIYLVCAWACL